MKRAAKRGKREDCDFVISVHFNLMNTLLTYYTDGRRANGLGSERENYWIMEKSKLETGKERKAGEGWRHRPSSCLREPAGQTGCLSINALVSSWKWNNKWAFRTLSGLFHAWMFSFNFSVNPLGKRGGMLAGTKREQHTKREIQRYKLYKVEIKRRGRWKKRRDER